MEQTIIKKMDAVFMMQKELTGELLKKQLVENKEVAAAVISAVAPKTLNELMVHFSTSDKNEIIRLIVGMDAIPKEKAFGLINTFLMELYAQMEENLVEIHSLEELVELLFTHPKIRLRRVFKSQG